MIRRIVMVCAVSAALGAAAPARAEMSEIIIARQYGISVLPLMMMERDGAVEKKAAAAGMPGLKVSWRSLGGPSAVNDALLSGSVQIGTVGPPVLVTLWARTHGTSFEVKGISSHGSYPITLNVRNPAVRSVRDFTEADKIAVASVKVSAQALVVQMAAAREFGPENWAKLDPYTVALSLPDGLLALMSGTAGVTAHTATPPYTERELKTPGVRRLVSSYDLLEGPGSGGMVVCSAKFRTENPTIYRAFFDALHDTIEAVNKDKPAAAQAYIDISNDRSTPVDELTAIISDPSFIYTMTPRKLYATAAFLERNGSIKQKPQNWQEMFFPEGAALPGD